MWKMRIGPHGSWLRPHCAMCSGRKICQRFCRKEIQSLA
ncbi:unnamed protein product [Echinostoma caproni]|uniref:DUF2256 domain-containing protein n=1 Tax=Echinostoma caproni TaxID=27848 RepID=A0A183B861_9TREM|nr:unnamed protein product [Echinostoma caproni]